MSFMANMVSASGGSASGSSIFSQGMQSTGQILGGLSSYYGYKDQAKYMASNARNAMKEAENEAAYQRERYSRLASTQRAGFGASGVDVNVGSPLDVIADTDAQGELAAMQAIYGGRMEEFNWNLRKQSAKQKSRNAMFGVLTTLADPMDWAGGSKFKQGFYSSGGGNTLGDM